MSPYCSPKQDLPKLQHLMLEKDENMTSDTPPESWDYNPTVNREQARVFFSRLSSVTYGHRTKIEYDDYACPAFLDAAHPNLRQITFPSTVPPLFEHEFFEKRSDALSVVDMGYNPLHAFGFETLANRCTGLKAFGYRYTTDIDVDAFEYFMELRGPRLVALDLGRYCSDSIESELFRSIARQCRSLEVLGICTNVRIDDAETIEDDVVNVIRQCGQSLRYIDLNFSVPHWITRQWRFLQKDLFETIADYLRG
ncbi:hypothetical protein HK102_001020 [Quaeritorhiza haematococci]|nr:hypothetical protein HK102_001020 [Quaeritorhiza haematococci]